MSIHNRSTTGVLLAVAGAMVLLGFGCKAPERTIPAAENAPVVQSGDTGDEGTTDVSVIAWTTYESPTLGIRVPYPEGWYVEESESVNEQSTTFYSTPVPPVATERPVEAWISRLSGSVEDAIAGLDIRSDTNVERSGITMRRIVFFEDFYAQPNVVLYLWERDGYTYELGGPSTDVVERIVNELTQRR